MVLRHLLIVLSVLGSPVFDGRLSMSTTFREKIATEFKAPSEFGPTNLLSRLSCITIAHTTRVV